MSTSSNSQTNQDADDMVSAWSDSDVMDRVVNVRTLRQNGGWANVGWAGQSMGMACVRAAVSRGLMSQQTADSV